MNILIPKVPPPIPSAHYLRQTAAKNKEANVECNEKARLRRLAEAHKNVFAECIQNINETAMKGETATKCFHLTDTHRRTLIEHKFNVKTDVINRNHGHHAGYEDTITW